MDIDGLENDLIKAIHIHPTPAASRGTRMETLNLLEEVLAQNSYFKSPPNNLGIRIGIRIGFMKTKTNLTYALSKLQA